MQSKQRGVSLIGFLVILMVVGFFGYMAMKLVPAYTEYMGVVKAMNGQASAGSSGKSLDEIRRELMFKFDNQYVGSNTVKPTDITISHNQGGTSTLQIAYDKDIPFMYNIDFLLHFSKSVPLRGDVATNE